MLKPALSILKVQLYVHLTVIYLWIGSNVLPRFLEFRLTTSTAVGTCFEQGVNNQFMGTFFFHLAYTGYPKIVAASRGKLIGLVEKITIVNVTGGPTKCHYNFRIISTPRDIIISTRSVGVRNWLLEVVSTRSTEDM